eukprot:6462387-Amphidinium_carterae.1
MIEPDPELGTAPSIAVPVLLDLDEVSVGSTSRIYVVWRLGGSPDGEYSFSGIHLGHPSWEGIQSLLPTGAYLRGRDKLRRVDAPVTGSILEATRRLYLDEHQVHGAPSR